LVPGSTLERPTDKHEENSDSGHLAPAARRSLSRPLGPSRNHCGDFFLHGTADERSSKLKSALRASRALSNWQVEIKLRVWLGSWKRVTNSGITQNQSGSTRAD